MDLSHPKGHSSVNDSIDPKCSLKYTGSAENFAVGGLHIGFC